MKYLNKETNGITLSRIGLGAMRMADVQQGVDTIHAALDSGITYLNTGDFYGHGESELVIREALKTRKREDIFIAVKFGGMPGNMNNLMKQAQKMQRQMEVTQKEMEEKEYEATAAIKYEKNRIKMVRLGKEST